MKNSVLFTIVRHVTLAGALVAMLTSPLRASTVPANQSGPQIQVISPALGSICCSNIDLDIRFEATNAPVDLASLTVKVRKLVRIDITNKVRPHVSDSGILWKDLHIPKGSHTIEVSVADVNKVKTSRIFTVVVK
jgi:hypothetical protein